jgi:hypothetical protein
MQNAEIELVRPPVTVHGFTGAVRYRAFAGVFTIMSVHIFFSVLDCVR